MAKDLNEAMQRFLRAWAEASAGHNGQAMIDQASIGWFAQLNAGLRDELDEAGFLARMRLNTDEFRNLAREIVAKATDLCPPLRDDPIVSLLGPADAAAPARFLAGIRGEAASPADMHRAYTP